MLIQWRGAGTVPLIERIGVSREVLSLNYQCRNTNSKRTKRETGGVFQVILLKHHCRHVQQLEGSID